MARFAFILPRAEMIEPAGRIAAELDMKVVLNRSVPADQVLTLAEECRLLGADILVARGRQASILKEHTDFPVVEIRLTGQEVALLLHRAKGLVPRIPRPKIGVVTIPNMVEAIDAFSQVLDIDLHTYFVSGSAEMERGAEQAIVDGMDVILGGDFVNAYCRRLGKRTLFFDGTEDSLRAALRYARSVGFAADAERRNTARLQVLLDHSFNGILELDARGIVLRANDIACKILERERGALEGTALDSLMPKEDAELWNSALSRREELSFCVLRVSNVHVVVNAVPVSYQDTMGEVVVSFYELHKMERQDTRALRERYRLRRFLAHGHFEDVDHTSRAMQQVIRLARSFAATMQPILLQGEAGCGKLLFAQSIHNVSPCSNGPFVAFDCGLDQPGQRDVLVKAIQDAGSGTLYLSGIDQLSANSQHTLYRLLREGVVLPSGETVPQPLKVRVIGSSTGILSSKLAEGGFQPELYYLLAPLLLSIPPLRDRPEDLETAIDAYLDACVSKLDRFVGLTKEAKRVLMDYPWPGNHIQLRAFLERIALTAPSRTVGDGYVYALLRELYPAPPPAPASDQEPLHPEAAALLDALARNRGSRAAAAAELGISKTTLWRRMKQYHLQMPLDPK